MVVAADTLLLLTTGLPIPARFSSLVPVTLLFGPPVYLLGFISPYAAELSTKETTGNAAGHVYALGTVGSIIGAFATTFFLIPSFSVTLVGVLFGIILILAALRVSLPDIQPQTVSLILLASILLVGAVSVNATSLRVDGEVVYETQTPYQQLRVVDDDGIRTLYLGGQRHSAMELDDPYQHVFDYTRYFHLPLLMREDIDRVLFIGGGGFTGPKIFAKKYNFTIDVVEIDPVVIRVAKRYFGVEESSQMNIYNADGRQFLQSTNRTYDVIILDAYQKDKVPFHLTTREFMQLAKQRLDANGILLANLIAAPSGAGSKFFRAEYKTMAAVFPTVYAFPTSRTNFVQNIELIATKRPDRLSREALLKRNRRRDIGINLSYEISFYRTNVKTGDVPILRDDRAPITRLLEPMIGQKYVIEQNRTRTAA
ncbi:MAG: spermidine synthase, partial [Halobacteriaceae archaeon]